MERHDEILQEGRELYLELQQIKSRPDFIATDEQHVLNGARETNLPGKYIGAIESVPAIKDYDTVREMEQLSIHG